MTRDMKILTLDALLASIHFANEITSIMDLNPALVSHLNRTATITNMRKRLDTMNEWVDALAREGDAPASPSTRGGEGL